MGANTGRYTFAVDLYSFGVMIYMLLSGGQESATNRQRMPPTTNSRLAKNIRQAEHEAASGSGPAWAHPDLKALPLVKLLVSTDPEQRTTPTLVKRNVFFEQQLGCPVDNLLTDIGPFSLPPAVSS